MLARSAPGTRWPFAVCAESEFLLQLISSCALPQAHGWKGEAGFRVATMMHVNGVSVTEAQELFNDWARRVQ